MMVVFLVGLVAMILMRTLKRDYARFTEDDDEEAGLDVGDESGWKRVRGDVFRAPKRLLAFSVMYGTGIQLLVLALFVISLSLFFYHRFSIPAFFPSHFYFSHFVYQRGSTVSAFIGCYAVTALVAGYFSGSFFLQYRGKNWIKCMALTASTFPLFVFAIAFVLDLIAMFYGTNSIPIGTMIAVIAIWVFFSVPLTLLGTLIGRHWSGKANHPCRVTPVPAPIPEKQWYQEPWAHVVLSGILPFGSIFIEMYFVFTAFWQYKYYYVFGFLFLVFLILIIVTVCVTIVSTYFLLNSEDYR